LAVVLQDKQRLPRLLLEEVLPEEEGAMVVVVE
jgi:hypothetical protein